MKKKWTDPKKKKKKKNKKVTDVACPWKKKKKVDRPKKKKIDDEVTLSHIGKSTTQSRRTKYLKNGTLREDYNASRRLKVRASRVSGAMYQWPTMQKNAQSYI